MACHAVRSRVGMIAGDSSKTTLPSLLTKPVDPRFQPSLQPAMGHGHSMPEQALGLVSPAYANCRHQASAGTRLCNGNDGDWLNIANRRSAALTSATSELSANFSNTGCCSAYAANAILPRRRPER